MFISNGEAASIGGDGGDHYPLLWLSEGSLIYSHLRCPITNHFQGCEVEHFVYNCQKIRL